MEFKLNFADFFLKEEMSVYKYLPIDPSGYRDVSYTYADTILKIKFCYFDSQRKEDAIGEIVFEYCVSLFMIENGDLDELQIEMDDTVYFCGQVPFRGRKIKCFCVQFSNSDQIYIVHCEGCSIVL